MTLSAFFAAAFLIGAQQPSPPLGQRTTAPQQILQAMAAGMSEEEAAIAAAQSRPLGTAENPVRVGGPEGESAYIARLRCADGNAPQVGQRASSGIGAFGSIVDSYPLDCGAAAPGQVTLIMDMYHEEHREERAPAGFTIVPRAAE